ncbi:MAG: DUF429 domain-containing protein [Hyphomicrobium sp.]
MRDGEIWIAGVDGCRGGWMVVTHPVDQPAKARVEILATFAAVIALPERPRVIAIDIPIGLPERTGLGGRACDAAARTLLGARQSSVFSVPARVATMQDDFAAACDIAAYNSDPPRKVSKQTFNLFPKIREVDALMTPNLQERVVECHPELAFWRLNGRRALDQPKKVKSRPWPAGLALRRQLLMSAQYLDAVIDRARFNSADAGADDILDAFANAAAAVEIMRGGAHRVPDDPPRDAKGLRMEIWG